MASTTFTVRGQKVRTQSHFRYQIVSVREHSIRTTEGTLVEFARIDGRSDSLATAKSRAQRMDRGVGVAVVVVDRTTGEEV